MGIQYHRPTISEQQKVLNMAHFVIYLKADYKEIDWMTTDKEVCVNLLVG